MFVEDYEQPDDADELFADADEADGSEEEDGLVPDDDMVADADDAALAALVVVVPAAAIVDGTPIANFQDLKDTISSFTTASDDMEIIIGGDIAITTALTIQNNYGKTLTIKSASTSDIKTLTRDTSVTGNLFTVTANAKLILKNITIDGNKANATNVTGSLGHTSGIFTLNGGATLQNNALTGNNVVVGVYSATTFTDGTGKVSNYTITKQETGTLTVSAVSYTLTVNAGTVVTISATPNSNYSFCGWLSNNGGTLGNTSNAKS